MLGIPATLLLNPPHLPKGMFSYRMLRDRKGRKVKPGVLPPTQPGTLPPTQPGTLHDKLGGEEPGVQCMRRY
jgi:hypothetical protein